MLNRIVRGAAVVALAGAFAPTASANCVFRRAAATYNAVTVAYTYWYATPESGNGDPVGQTWQLGSYGTWNDRASGVSSACQGGLYPAAAAYAIGLDLEMSTCGTGCPAPGATLAYLAMAKGCCQGGDTSFLLATLTENDVSGLAFDYTVQGKHYLSNMPRPRVNSSSPAGNLLNLQLSVGATAGPSTVGPNAAGAITGYNILGRQSAFDPGRSASFYTTTVATLTTTAGGPVGPVNASVDCTNSTQSWWLVTQLVLENGATSSDAVSGATRVSCGPGNLADPRFKIVHKRPATTKH